MRAGDLDRRVSVLRPVVVSTNAVNESISEYRTVYNLWAALQSVGADERVAGDQRVAVFTVKFRTRFFPVQATDRLRCEGRTYEVLGWTEVGRRIGLDIIARAIE